MSSFLAETQKIMSDLSNIEKELLKLFKNIYPPSQKEDGTEKDDSLISQKRMTYDLLMYRLSEETQRARIDNYTDKLFEELYNYLVEAIFNENFEDIYELPYTNKYVQRCLRELGERHFQEYGRIMDTYKIPKHIAKIKIDQFLHRIEIETEIIEKSKKMYIDKKLSDNDVCNLKNKYIVNKHIMRKIQPNELPRPQEKTHTCCCF